MAVTGVCIVLTRNLTSLLLVTKLLVQSFKLAYKKTFSELYLRSLSTKSSWDLWFSITLLNTQSKIQNIYPYIPPFAVRRRYFYDFLKNSKCTLHSCQAERVDGVVDSWKPISD